MLPKLADLRTAAEVVSRTMSPTPQYRWPLLSERLDLDVWVKHENHTPLGAFKVRGGLVYFDALRDELAGSGGVICATRGNHGQSVAFAAASFGVPVTIVVPLGNSKEKNAAMVSLGADLIEHGDDFQAAFEHAQVLAEQQSLHMVPSFHPLLVAGVGTYSMELFEAVPNLDVFYVPIGMGSGVCGAIAAREALGLKTQIVGVVSTEARACAESFARGEVVELPATTRIADGMACRKPNPDALAIIRDGVDRIVEVTDEEVEQAMRDIFECTHNVAEGAGAAAVAAIRKDASRLEGKVVGGVLCGGNIDRSDYVRVLNG